MAKVGEVWVVNAMVALENYDGETVFTSLGVAKRAVEDSFGPLKWNKTYRLDEHWANIKSQIVIITKHDVID